jgi:hypothetical protein
MPTWVQIAVVPLASPSSAALLARSTKSSRLTDA